MVSVLDGPTLFKITGRPRSVAAREGPRAVGATAVDLDGVSS